MSDNSGQWPEASTAEDRAEVSVMPEAGRLAEKDFDQVPTNAELAKLEARYSDEAAGASAASSSSGLDSAEVDERLASLMDEVSASATQPVTRETTVVSGYPSSESTVNEGPAVAAAPVQNKSDASFGSVSAPVSASAGSGTVGTAAQDAWREEKKKMKMERRGKGFWSGLLGGIIGAAVVLLLAFLIGGTGLFPRQTANPAGDTSSSDSQEKPQVVNISPSAKDADLAEAVAAKALPSVVSIDVYAPASSGSFGPFNTGDGTADSNSLTAVSLGSGVILSSDGYILTNYHVVEGGTVFLVHINDDLELEATLVGSDASSDLAVLKVDAKGLIPFEIGDSDKVQVGEWCMVLGSPFGYEKSISVGVVSALYRSSAMQSQTGYTIYANMIQTDTAINPGNSGGALVNDKGELIGIPTLITSYSGSSSGVGFCIPINYAMNVADQIMEHGEVTHAFMGVTLEDAPSKSGSVPIPAGAYVSSVESGSPAEKAGIQEGDVIVSFNGTNVTTASELIIDIRSSFVGDVISIGYIRNGEEHAVDVTLAGYAAAETASTEGNATDGGDTNDSSDLYEFLYEYLYGK